MHLIATTDGAQLTTSAQTPAYTQAAIRCREHMPSLQPVELAHRVACPQGQPASAVCCHGSRQSRMHRGMQRQASILPIAHGTCHAHSTLVYFRAHRVDAGWPIFFLTNNDRIIHAALFVERSNYFDSSTQANTENQASSRQTFVSAKS